MNPRPYHQADGVTIYHGSAAEMLPELGLDAACVVTSPPYNAAIGYDAYDDAIPWPEYWETHEPVLRACAGALTPGGRLWWNVAPDVPIGEGSGTGRVQLHAEWSERIARVLVRRLTIAWTSMRGAGTQWGSWQSPAAPNLRGDWEAIILAFKLPFARSTPAEWKGWRDGGADWPELCRTVWTMQPEHRDANGHPAPFPVELPSRCIRLSTWPGELVIDPYLGSGATAVAARRLGRTCVGFDVSERYCEIAAHRLEAEVSLFDRIPDAVDPAGPAVVGVGLFD